MADSRVRARPIKTEAWTNTHRHRDEYAAEPVEEGLWSIAPGVLKQKQGRVLTSPAQTRQRDEYAAEPVEEDLGTSMRQAC